MHRRVIISLRHALKARHLSGSAFCTGFSRLEVPEQALDGIPLGLGLVVKINLLNFHVHSPTSSGTANLLSWAARSIPSTVACIKVCGINLPSLL